MPQPNVFDNTPIVDPLEMGQVDDNSAGDDGSQTVDPANSDADVQQPEGQSTDDSGEGTVQTSTDNPEWSSKFKTPEEIYAEYKKLEKSYNHLRPEYTKLTQELSNIRKTSTTSDPGQGQSQVPNVTPNVNPQVNPNNQIIDTVKNLIQPIQEQQSALEMQNEVAKMAHGKKDFQEVAPELQNVLSQNPELWNLGTTRALEIAYSVAKTKLIETQVTQAVEQASQQSYKNKEVKVLTGGERPKVAGNSTDTASPEESIISEILGVSGGGNHIF